MNNEEHFRSKTLVFLYLYFENGGKLFDKTLRIATPIFFSKKNWFQKLGILREYYISIFDDINNQLEKFLRINPDVIRGFTSGIRSLAIKIKKENIKINFYPKVIFTTAEVLRSADRALLSSIFKSEVIDYYCCNEIGIMAYECSKHSGYHLNADNVIIEFIKEDGSFCKEGEIGDIVVTGLNRLTMPFIRYKIGDRGIPKYGKCRCGKGYLIMESIIGRDNDQIILPDNRIISSYFLSEKITSIKGILEFQIIQKDKNNIYINIIKDKNIDDDLIITQVKTKFEQALDNMLVIKPLIVKEIAKDKTGKLKVIKNEISNSSSDIF